jgi:hypothetical protein
MYIREEEERRGMYNGIYTTRGKCTKSERKGKSPKKKKKGDL